MIPLSRSILRQASRKSRLCVSTGFERCQSTVGSDGRRWSTPLAKSLGEAIMTTGPIPVASYMRQCLTASPGGYYTSLAEGHDQFGQKGDFITSPEISQVFGELVGLWIVAEWITQGKKSSGVNIIELGPGRGTLMDDMLRTFSNFKPLEEAIDTVYLVEASSHLRETQRRLLCGNNEMQEIDIGYKSKSKYGNGKKIVWCEDIKFIPSDDNSTPFIVAHEFFDALPIHVFQSVTSSRPTLITSANSAVPPQKPPNEWRELLVAPASPYSNISSPEPLQSSEPLPDFTLVLSKEPTPHSTLLPLTSPRYSALLPHTGSTIEISPESLSHAAHIARLIGGAPPGRPPSGAALILDYGPAATIPTNTLRGIRVHRTVSPFGGAGAVDLSADVDFVGLAEAALAASARVAVHGPVEQSAFLGAMGVHERAARLVAEARDEQARGRIEGAVRRLVDRGPAGMGRVYKALAVLPYWEGGPGRRPVGFGGDVVA